MQRTTRYILVIFCLALITPSLGQWLNINSSVSLTENRKLAAKPEFAWSWPVLKKFPARYKVYYNDNFTFRSLLVQANFLLRYGILGVSTSDQVVAGREGWLFHTGFKEMEDCRGINRLNDDQLRTWALTFILKRDWLAQQGIRYLLVIPPNKCTVYPEHLPDGYARVRGSWLDDFMAYLRTNTNLEVIDLREILIKHKQQHQVYFRMDTHWNDYGAFLGYKELIRPVAAWFPTITPFEFSDFSITVQKRSGDLMGMMGGHGYLFDEQYEFIPLKQFSSKPVNRRELPMDPITMEKNVLQLPRAVIFHDSFFLAIIPFISEHFSISRYIWKRWHSQQQIENIISEYKPHIIIEESVERLLKKDFDGISVRIPSYLAKFAAEKSASTARVMDMGKIRPSNQVILQNTAKGLVVNASGDDPQLLVPVSETADNSSNGTIVQINIESPAETQLQLFYKTVKAPDYTEARSYTVNLHKGTNEVYMLLPDPGIIGPMRLDPGTVKGSYTLYRLVTYKYKQH